MAEPVAPIIVTVQMGRADQAWADDLRHRHFPPERNHLAAHITLFHHLPPSLEPELRTQLAQITAEAKPDARIIRAYSLGRGVALLVDSPALIAIREELAERFARYLTPQDIQRARLHITVQNKVSPDVARRTLEEVASMIRTPRALEIAGLALWHYRGGPWSPIAHWPFRGHAKGR